MRTPCWIVIMRSQTTKEKVESACGAVREVKISLAPQNDLTSIFEFPTFQNRNLKLCGSKSQAQIFAQIPCRDMFHLNPYLPLLSKRAFRI